MAVMVELRAVLSAHPEQVAHARHLVAEYLTESDAVDAGEGHVDREIAILLVSELVTNAVMHGVSPFELRAQQTRSGLRVEVHDNNALATPVLRGAGVLAESGRGLQLVDTLADRWGWSEDGAGKVVWFEIGE